MVGQTPAPPIRLLTRLTYAATSPSLGLVLALSGQTGPAAISSATVWAEQGGDVEPCLCRRDAPSTLLPNRAEQGKISNPRSKTGQEACSCCSGRPRKSSFLLLSCVGQSIPCYSTDQGINSNVTGPSIALNRAEAHHNRRSGKIR